MTNTKILSLFLVFCLPLLAAACGEKNEDGRETPTAAKREPALPWPAFGNPVVYNFDSDATSKPPAKFSSARTGRGSEGVWVVLQDPTAPSKPNVLAQTSTDTTDYRFPLAVLEEGSYQDVAVSVKFKAISGKVDQGAGIVFRYQDPNNYYVARANALEDNYNLYHVIAGRRRQITGTHLRVTPNQWHTLRVEMVVNQIKCYYDGELKITTRDDTFKGPGKVGLWTKADSVTYFDDLEVSTP